MNEPSTGPFASLLAFLHRHGGVAALILVAAGLAVRLPGFTEWWLNPDEGIYYSILTRDAFGAFWREVSENAHPPLYYLLLRGMGLFTWDFLWFRGLSLVLGVAGIWVFWLLGRELAGGGVGGTLAGLFAGLMVAFAPGAVALSQVMRPYTLQVLLLSGALLFLLRYRNKASGRALAAYIALLSLSLLTHYSSVLAAGAFAAAVLYMGWEGRVERTEWRRLVVAHVFPGLIVAGLYALHAGQLAGSSLANDALEGWLAPYMVSGPAEGWLAFLGFQSLAAPPWLRGPLAVLTLVALGAAAWNRRWLPVVLGGAAMAIALAGAGLGVYPLGATRHTMWLMVFLVPVAAGFLGLLASPSRRTSLAAAGLVVALVSAGGPVGRLVGVQRAPWAPTEHVLLWEDMVKMLPAVEPAGSPRIMLMSNQTFFLLLPFYPSERETATFSADGDLFHFRNGERDVFVSQVWDFTSGTEGLDSPAHLAYVLRRLRSDFPEAFTYEPAALLVGGWRPPLVDELLGLGEEHPGMVRLQYVPGLFGFVLDLAGYMEAMR